MKSDKRIKYILSDSTKTQTTFGDILKDTIFERKVTYIVMYFYVKNPDNKKDIPYFKKLCEKYKNQSFQILYTNSGFDDFFERFEQQLLIRQNGIFGYHMTVPQKLEITMEIKKNNGLSYVPKYLLAKNGIIVDTFATRPSHYKELCKKIDDLLRN